MTYNKVNRLVSKNLPLKNGNISVNKRFFTCILKTNFTYNKMILSGHRSLADQPRTS